MPTALLAGATGLVGRECLRLLLDEPSWERVIVVARRPPEVAHPRLATMVTPFDRLASCQVAGATHAFCALGTTIAAAGSQEAFRQVDHDYVLAFADLARRAGCRTFVLVSSVGADERSRTFYLRVKGETEAAVCARAFDAVHLLRPGLLLGARTESRPAEAVARALAPLLNPLLLGPLGPYRAVTAADVARAMVRAALAPDRGVTVHDSPAIERLAAGLTAS